MKEDLSPDSMRGFIEEARGNNIKLYLIGVSHTFYNVMQEIDLVRLVEPHVILMESYTPNSTYSAGIATEEFEEELAKGRSEWQSPNLHSIKSIVDALDCYVSGCDIPNNEKRRLEKECNLTSRRINQLYSQFFEELSILLHNQSYRLSDNEYLELDSLRDKVSEIESIVPPVDAIDDVNRILGAYMTLYRIVEPSKKTLTRYLKGVLEKLNEFGKDAENYLSSGEKEFWKKIRENYDGEKRVLLFTGASHLREKGFFIRVVEESQIPHLKLIVVDMDKYQ